MKHLNVSNLDGVASAELLVHGAMLDKSGKDVAYIEFENGIVATVTFLIASKGPRSATTWSFTVRKPVSLFNTT